jgi:glycosyltransferase involved in cell wall biosynthesis
MSAFGFSILNSNAGYTNRLNFGLQKAQGEFIARLDSDDISFSTRLEKQVLVLEQNKDYLACGTNIELFGNDWLDFNWVVTGPTRTTESIITG